MSKTLLLCFLNMSLVQMSWGKQHDLVVLRMNGQHPEKKDILIDVASNANMGTPNDPKRPFSIDGATSKWQFYAFSDDTQRRDYVTITGRMVNNGSLSPWKVESIVYCDSEDSLFIDGITLKCKEEGKPIKYWEFEYK